MLFDANATNTLLGEHYLVPVSTPVVAVTGLLAAAALIATTLALPLWLGPAVLGAVGAATWLGAAALARAGHLLDVTFPLTAALLAFLVTAGWRGSIELRQRRQVTQLFSQYVPAEVARQLLEQDLVEEAAAGQRRDVAVLFCDLRGFTLVAGALPAGKVRELLDTYYTKASAVVLAHRGTLMQFVGDEVFAVFGAPVPQPEAAEAGLRCAQDLQRATGSLAAKLAALDQR